jgi:hypothetical protein
MLIKNPEQNVSKARGRGVATGQIAPGIGGRGGGRFALQDPGSATRVPNEVGTER